MVVYKVVFFKVILLALVTSLASCEFGEKDLSDLNLYQYAYQGKGPVLVENYGAVSADAHLPAAWMLEDYSFLSSANLEYVPTPGDSLHLRILDFDNDMSALAFFLNSGLVQEKIPVTEGENLEFAMRAGKRLFIFRYSRLRPYDRGILEQLVRSFPGYREGLPQEFLSLPFADRELDESSIQMKNFLGVESGFPMLVLGYSGGNVRWNCARSWSYVSDGAWNSWILGLGKSGRWEIFRADTLRFEAGAGARGMAMRLKGGRIVCLWGFLSEENLQQRFAEVAKTVYDAKE